jgi:hypothetical protein
MRLLKQSTARDIVVFMTDSSDHVSGKTGLTLTITASKNAAAFASITPTVTELATGWYKLALTTSHTDTLGDLALHITATGADPTDTLMQVLALLPGDAVTLQSGQVVASVTGAVGSVTGNVGGNVAGSVGSVTAGVTVSTNNDKTGYAIGAGGIESASFAAGAIDNAAIAADAIGSSELAQSAAREIADEVLDRNLAGGGSGDSRNVRNALRSLRNKASIAGGTLTVCQEDDSTTAWTAAVTTAAGDPINSIDPT